MGLGTIENSFPVSDIATWGVTLCVLVLRIIEALVSK